MRTEPTKYRRARRCAPPWVVPAEAAAVLAALAGGYVSVAFTGAGALFAGLVLAVVAFLTVQQAHEAIINAAHRCGAVQQAQSMLDDLKAYGVKVVRLDEDGVSEL